MLAAWRAYLPPLARNVEAGGLLEAFLVSAVASLLVIRGYLALMNYPQIGGGGLHIAHMLWGGVLLVVALVLALAYLGRRVRYLAAVLGGIGFGTFIDELGKFITSDNDYFYRPTIAIIYVVFVLMFLAFRAIDREQPLSEQERVLNALSTLQDLRLAPGDPLLTTRLSVLLASADAADPVVVPLRALAADLRAAPAGEPAWPRRLWTALIARYQRLCTHRWFQHGVALLFVLNALGPLLLLVVAAVPAWRAQIDVSLHSHFDLANAAAVALVWAFAAVGAVRLLHSRLAAYQWFKRSTLVSLLLLQVFQFYEEQLTAVIELGIDLLLLGVLNYMIAAERAMMAEEARPEGSLAGVPSAARG